MQNPQDVQLAARDLAEFSPDGFFSGNTVGVILGTGLSHFGHELAKDPRSVRVPFLALPKFPASGVKSHDGAFIAGKVNNVPVLAQLGRCHLYEGRSPAEVCMGVRVMGQLGIKTLILTNAAGALNPLFKAGTLMCLADYINFTGVSPLTGPNHDLWGERFPDMSRAFDPELQDIAMSCALSLGTRLERGIYIGVHGPEMETPAETRMYRQWGADAVGMSSVLEIIAARHMGMKVLGISCLTNQNLPDCMKPAPLEEILRVAGDCGRALAALLNSILARLARPGEKSQ